MLKALASSLLYGTLLLYGMARCSCPTVFGPGQIARTVPLPALHVPLDVAELGAWGAICSLPRQPFSCDPVSLASTLPATPA